MRRRGLFKVKDKVILHLANFKSMDDTYHVPQAVSQVGIADAIGAKQNSVSLALKALKKEGYVNEKTVRFTGIKSKRKAYFPSERGLAWARKLEKEIGNKVIIIRDLDGTVKEMKISILKDHLQRPLSLLEIDIFCGYDGIFDCDEALKKSSIADLKGKRFFVNNSEKAPIQKHFFGREKELKKMENWISSKTNRIVVIFGIPGIGKTTLALKLLSHHKEKCNLFWYQFHEWDSLRNLADSLSLFLEKIGKGSVSSHLKNVKTIDINVLSGLLQKDLDNSQSLLFFDDFHRAQENIIRFFSSLAERLEGMEAVKMVVIGRYILPFYDRKDVVIKNLVAEMQLEGLDEASSRKFLRAKGISDPHIKKIYKMTKGHPLTMELIESVDDLKDQRNVKRYINEEIFSKLSKEEKRLLSALSVYRYPVSPEAFFTEENLTHECLDSLQKRSLVYETKHDRYDVHELIREFFYKRLTPQNKRKYHKNAATYYLSQIDIFGIQHTTTPQNLIESLYHFLRGGELESATKLTVEHGIELINQGYLEELMNLLDDFNFWLTNIVSKEYETNLLLLRGEALSIGGDWDHALDIFKEVLILAEQRGEHNEEAEANRKIGNLFLKKNQYDEAMNHLKKALVLSRKMSDYIGEADTYRGFGKVYWRRGEYDKAVNNYNKAIECIEKIKDKKNNYIKSSNRALHIPVMASIYIDLGLISDDKGDYEKAIGHYENSLKLFNQINDLPEMARVYNNLGVAWYRSGDLDKSIDYYEKCIEIAEKIHDATLKSWVLFNAGEAYAKKHDFERATNYCDKSLEILKRLDYQLGISGVYSTYGIIYKMKKDWEKANDYFQKSIKIREKMDIPYRLADGYYEYGLMFKEKGDKKRARSYLKKALKIFEKLGNKRLIKKINSELKEI